MAHRLNKIGSVIRIGDLWYLTEYSLGNSIFEYLNSDDLKRSKPVTIHTLETVSFTSTNNAICKNNFIFYDMSTSRIYLISLKTGNGTYYQMNTAKVSTIMV